MLIVNDVYFGYTNLGVIRGVSFDIQAGQNISILGESGCGKSTLLKLICGLYNLDSGEIVFNQKQILGPEHNLVPDEKNIKLLTQDFDLMPFVSVSDNIGKHLSNLDLKAKRKRISELLQMIEMQDFSDVHARYLSGGQKQRVALARAIALEPQLLLLDEPFNQIDGFRKNAFRRNLFNYLKQRKISCIVATHDTVDALSFADKVLVMQSGKILAQATPMEMYQNPPNKYVASLFGEVNEIAVRVLFPNYEYDTNVLIYPHELKVNSSSLFQVKVRKSYFKGNKYLVQAQYDKKVVFFESLLPINEGELVGLEVGQYILNKRIKNKS